MSGNQQLITDKFPKQKGPATRTSKRLENKPKPVVKKDDVASTSRSNSDILRDKELNILKKFDVKMEYGPCTGISRLERWSRADKNDLNPPEKIRQIILKHENEPEFTQNVWHHYPL